MGDGREDGLRAELGIQPSSLWTEVAQDLDIWEGILLRVKQKSNSKKHEHFHLRSSSFIEMFYIFFLDTFKVYRRISVVAKNSMQLWIWPKVV